jgi:ABC-type Fe3+ transport system substrate-binding protein
VPTNQRVVLDRVVAGEYPLALATFTHHTEISLSKGAPVRWLKLDPLTATMDPIFLLKGAPHPNAAKLFIDFVVSPEGQAVFRDAGYIPADPRVPAQVPGLRPEIGNFTYKTLTPQLGAEKLPDWIAVYNELFK